MEGNIPNEFVDEVRTRFDVVELISEYVQLKRSGRNYFGLCPFHGEKTPSFSVSQDKQIFHCFGCGEGGNVFSFLMKMEGIPFPEAVKELARRAGMQLPSTVSSVAAQRAEQKKSRLREAMAWADKYYRYWLQHQDGAKALHYLEKRGLTREIIESFGLGFAPNRWEAVKQFLRKKDFTERELLDAGLLSDNPKKTYDRFRNRITFPICSPRGETIAFGGRILDDGEPKYLNSPETPLFDKGKNLYAIHLAREAIRREKQAIIFEGYMDVIAAHQAGVTNAVASLGTSLTEAQARLLRSQAEEVVIVYDADAAGQAATWRGLQILKSAGCLVKVGRLPAGMDPDDYIRRHGGDAFRKDIIGEALLLVDYQMASLAQQYSLDKDEDRIRLFNKISEILASVDNAMEREDYVTKAASMLKLPATAVREELNKKKQSASRPHSQTRKSSTIKPSLQRETASQKAPMQIIALWGRFPSLIEESAGQLEEEDFPAELIPAFLEAQKEKASFSAARLLDSLQEEKHRQTLSRLLIHEEYDEKIAKKAIDDCIRLLKCVRIARQRKELEAQMASLDPVAAKGEINELSKKWLELRKLEETINHPREGGKGVG
ncbi:DNA primase [Dethiobacter alkaliphilus]|uniref:DNA primase n=1 Tax=Dethiobacter alkaliphilus TaxID=427926 RepID=UPI002226E53B|nr:DNA primase [Dethiobacter alkaliphilus]MCW3489358.1 DNA primase [Dethiobacter alkaliphilus]